MRTHIAQGITSLALALFTLPCLQGSAEAQVFAGTFDISGAQEVPANASPATGTGVVVVDTSTLTVSWSITHAGLTGAETAAHMHGPAPVGANAGVQVGLGVGSPKVGSAAITPGQAADLIAGLWYVNIHSTAFPGGEIRGQIMVRPVPQVYSGTFPIDAGQEVPPNGSPASGVGTAVLNMSTLMLSWDMNFSGLTGAEVAAHFHGPAAAGTNAGVQMALGLGSPKSGSAAVSPAQAADIINGLWYVNIHSSVFPGGEIRGQVNMSQLPTGVDQCNGDSGDGAGCTNCPCLNNAPLGTIGGCLNSSGGSARLTASGSPSLSLPPGSVSDLRFGMQGATPSAFSVLLSGDAVAPTNVANPCFGQNSGIQAISFDG